MRVLHTLNLYAQDPTRYFHFSDYEKVCGNFILLEGGFTKPNYWNKYGFSVKELAELKSHKIVMMEFEEPTKPFVGDYPEVYSKDFHKILTLCPYTADYLNRKYHENKRIPIFFPFNERYIPRKRKKTIDVLYSGHLFAGELTSMLQSLRKFRLAVISNSKDPLVTHQSVSYREKIKLYSQSKIIIVHNVLFKQPLHRIINVWLSGQWGQNKAFDEIPAPWRPWELFKKHMYVPHLKSRAFEAAFSRSLILCQRDPFNVIERYFKPDREFIYFEPDNLKETVAGILSHYDDYQGIIDRAYKRAIRSYTVKAFVRKYLKKI